MQAAQSGTLSNLSGVTMQNQSQRGAESAGISIFFMAIISVPVESPTNGNDQEKLEECPLVEERPFDQNRVSVRSLCHWLTPTAEYSRWLECFMRWIRMSFVGSS
jgi:hypothetical protein